jgi:hypothetical protein
LCACSLLLVNVKSILQYLFNSCVNHDDPVLGNLKTTTGVGLAFLFNEPC